MKTVMLMALVLGSAAALAAEPVSRTAAFVAKAEMMAKKMLPQEQFNQAAGFFGPVSKKYMPVMQAFEKDYAAAKEKLPVVMKYLPQAESAYEEAKAMKVPEKYEAEKQRYLRMIEAFLSVVRMSVLMGGNS